MDTLMVTVVASKRSSEAERLEPLLPEAEEFDASAYLRFRHDVVALCDLLVRQ